MGGAKSHITKLTSIFYELDKIHIVEKVGKIQASIFGDYFVM